ncbi:hypothetical protein ACFS3C_13445 [Azotobacter vinelandii]
MLGQRFQGPWLGVVRQAFDFPGLAFPDQPFRGRAGEPGPEFGAPSARGHAEYFVGDGLDEYTDIFGVQNIARFFSDAYGIGRRVG